LDYIKDSGVFLGGVDRKALQPDGQKFGFRYHEPGHFFRLGNHTSEAVRHGYSQAAPCRGGGAVPAARDGDRAWGSPRTAGHMAVR